MKRSIFFIPVLFLLMVSCSTPKEVLYFGELAKSGDVVQVIPDSVKEYQPEFAPDDMLSITVTSLNPEAAAIFNLPLQTFLTPGETNIISTATLQSYLIDPEGYINYPVLGKIKMAGLTRNEATQFLQKELSKYIEDPIVNIQCNNFTFSVLGEVTKPGTYKHASERLTVLEALGYASDITIYGNHSNVLLIREQDGVRSYHRLDLTEPDIFTSPYYYIKHNDVIYVEPNDARKGYATYSQDKQYTVSIVSAITSAVSVIASLAIALFVK